MGQEHKEYTWNLIAKKLSGEASPEELKELELLLRIHPELHYPMQTITDLWNTASPHDQKAAEQAFTQHLDRIQDLNIDFGPHESLAGANWTTLSGIGRMTKELSDRETPVREINGGTGWWTRGRIVLASACCVA